MLAKEVQWHQMWQKMAEIGLITKRSKATSTFIASVLETPCTCVKPGICSKNNLHLSTFHQISFQSWKHRTCWNQNCHNSQRIQYCLPEWDRSCVKAFHWQHETMQPPNQEAQNRYVGVRWHCNRTALIATSLLRPCESQAVNSVFHWS